MKTAEVLGAGDGRMMFRHILLNATTPIPVLAAIQVAVIILLEPALSFFGLSRVDVSWGFDIALSRQYQSTAWRIPTVPGLVTVVAAIRLNLVDGWFRDAFDPGVEGEGGI